MWQRRELRAHPTWKGIDLDHLFVSAGLRDQVRSLTVDQGVADRELSDHAALVLDMQLSAAPVARSWDAETFVAEIGARHGSGAAATVQALVDWAGQKEDAIRRAGVRDRELTDFELPAAIDPSMGCAFASLTGSALRSGSWASMPTRGSSASASSTCTIRTPFDTDAGREPLRAMLNEIPGVDIPSERLKGRPRIRLAVLADAANLARLIAVLDGIVDQTRPTEITGGSTIDDGAVATAEDA